MSVTHVAAPASAALRTRLHVYALDGALLGLFMISACLSVTLVEHPASLLRQALPSDFVRRALVGLAMGATALGLVYSPWGKRSGALMNPAMTLAFVRLGKLEPRDALGYTVAQVLGGTLGVLASALVLGPALAHPAVAYVVTLPGAYGAGTAWLGELAISFVLVSVVMSVNRVPRLAPYTGCFAAALVALFITFEAPLSGMSLNPARTLASAVVARSFHGLWIYLTAPIAGVLAGVELLRSLERRDDRLCGKANHDRKIPSFLPCRCLERSGRHSA